ncbi:MAG: [NiFe]-hydrogenase assembly chaperone HybE [Pseudomonadota bacterium]
MSVRPARVDRLERAFEEIARSRMAGLPTVHPRLRVEALGFAPQPGPHGEDGWLGVLITPWCMNLVWLPATQVALRVGTSREHVLAGERYAFIGAHEPLYDLGPFEACSLFSPMGEFADHDGARAVALEVLRALRTVAPAQPARPPFPPVPHSLERNLTGPSGPSHRSRRAFLFGAR